MVYHIKVIRGGNMKVAKDAVHGRPHYFATEEDAHTFAKGMHGLARSDDRNRGKRLAKYRVERA